MQLKALLRLVSIYLLKLIALYYPHKLHLCIML